VRPHDYKVSFKRSITFCVGVDEISSIIKQYSKAGTDAIIVHKGESRFHVGFFIDFIGCKIFPKYRQNGFFFFEKEKQNLRQ
jgi:hypothetical protein